MFILTFVGIISLTADYGNKINNSNFSHNISLGEMANSGDALDRPSVLDPDSSSDKENLEKWQMRFAAYSIEADEHIVIMALARIRPSQLEFDPGFYIYGGSFIYPLGLYYFALEKFGVISISSFEDMLSSPDTFDVIYYYGRLFVSFFVALSAVLLFFICQRFVSTNTSLLYVVIFLLMPATIMFSQLIKPHYYALFWSNLALFFLIKSIGNESLGRFNSVIIGFSIGMAVGASFVYSLFSILLWIAILFCKNFSDRNQSLLVIPCISILIFLIFNPYLLINLSGSNQDINHLHEWFMFFNSNSLSNFFLYIKNSFSIGFGFAFTCFYAYLSIIFLVSKNKYLKIIGIFLIFFLVIMSFITSSISGWHINARYSPYIVPISLVLMAFYFKDKKIVPSLILIITFLQAIPLYVAYLDEDSPIFSTRLTSSSWINKNIPLDSYVCTSGKSIVPYDSPPFDFVKYNINQSRCDYLISVERQADKLIISSKYNLIKRFQPRYALSYIPLVFSHINPQISIYSANNE